jgi:hypothetical protein
MKHTTFILALLMLLGIPSFAQVSKEDREEKKAKAQTKVDYTVFRRQMLTLKEFSEQRRHAAELQRTTKGIVRAIVYVDSTNDADENKILIGYITMLIGNEPTNLYEVSFDRKLKNIVYVKPTGETVEVDEDKKPAKKPSAKTAKNPDDDDEEEKPVKKRGKDDDDE